MLDLTNSQLKCLLTVLELSRPGSDVASKEIAVQMRLSRPSVHRLLEGLIARDLVLKEPYGSVALSDRGREEALKIQRLRREGARALMGRFAMDAEEADRAMLLLLSGMAQETAEKIAASEG